MKKQNGSSASDNAARLFPDEWLLQFDDPYDRIHSVAKRYLAEVKAHEERLKASHHMGTIRW